MKLKEQPFSMIKQGLKTIELRLYDEKRRTIQIGDQICFHHDDETIDVVVTNLFIFPDFKSLYETLPLMKCGYTKDDIKDASPIDMNAYYTVEEQKKYGVIGIEIVLE